MRVLLVGDDWAEDHHDVELMDQAGRTLARARLPEGPAGMARLHAMIGEQLGEGAGDAEVRVGIETDSGLWVMGLTAAGYQVYGINPLQVARYRERHSVSGAKSDRADAHTWPTWSALMLTSCAGLRLIASRPPRSRWSPARIRR